MTKPTILLALSLCGLFLVTTDVQAQMGRPSIPTPKGIFNPIVGSGAQYEVDKSDGTKTNFGIAIVGKESAEGKDAYWLEMTASDARMGEMVIKELLVIDGNNAHPVKMVMLMPGRGPIEFPMSNRPNPMAPQPPEDIRNSADDLGSESVTVPAGTFSCEHYRGRDKDLTDVWVTKDAPPYGLVKMTDRTKDQTIVLSKLDKNVQDKITGTPMQFNPMMGAGPQ